MTEEQEKILIKEMFITNILGPVSQGILSTKQLSGNGGINCWSSAYMYAEQLFEIHWPLIKQAKDIREKNTEEIFQGLGVPRGGQGSN